MAERRQPRPAAFRPMGEGAKAALSAFDHLIRTVPADMATAA